MRSFKARTLSRLVISASVFGIAAVPGMAWAQDAAPGDTAAQSAPADQVDDEIVVTGIRASLREAVDIKRNAQGVVDAISAEDIGKFPDTNLAESLQRITGVSIDRSNGEGSVVTVRGFGPEFNLVTLNGRQMPTANLGDGGGAPSGRSFDFANLASEGVSAVEVYKSGRASVASGGIGSTINIRSPRPLDRPGLRGSVSAKGVWDRSRNDGDPITPELSGIISTTFGDGKFGILVNGTYQKRKGSINQADVGWRDGYLGNENNWGSLAQPGTPGAANITNRPDPTDVYQVPQNASYSLIDLDRERINGQVVLQARPVDGVTATVDYTYSRNTIELRNSNVGVWFNHGATTSSWTDGPVAGPNFYAETFDPPTAGVNNSGKDLSYSGSLTANRSENKSLGANLTWDAPGGMTMQLDFHHSTAESKPTNQYGSNMSVGNAVFGVVSQKIDFTNDLPVISYGMAPGVDALNPANIAPTGNAFRNAYFKDRINQIQLKGHYDHDGGFLDSLDFGASYVENKVRSAFGVLQNDTWGGPPNSNAGQIPDDIFHLVTVPDKFKGIGGAGTAGMIPSFYTFDFERMVDLIDGLYGTCGGDGNCLTPYTTDRRITEKTLAPYLQMNAKWDVFSRPTHLIAGLRYEHTSINSAALVPVTSGTNWVSDNEFNVVLSGQSDFTRFKGEYQNWLPNVDFDIEPLDGVKLRASYSHTITRPDYASMQGGRTLDLLFRSGVGGGQLGNPGLLPYKAKNIDLSAEWYYGRDSYVSVGYFHKDVSNFIGSDRIDTQVPGLTNPFNGPRADAARAALGANASNAQIRQYIFSNYPNSVVITGGQAGSYTGNIIGLPEDAPVNFQINTPVNNDQTAKLSGWEFAIQHSFWNTGFGAILNYTIVNGDATYDNTKPSSVTQFALTGLSDSANAVLFFDKFGINARVAYNWRDEFLAGTGANPTYVEAYGQVDASASYEFMKGITAFVEGINLTGADRRGHQRSDQNVTFVSTGDARYAAGLRLAF